MYATRTDTAPQLHLTDHLQALIRSRGVWGHHHHKLVLPAVTKHTKQVMLRSHHHNHYYQQLIPH